MNIPNFPDSREVQIDYSKPAFDRMFSDMCIPRFRRIHLRIFLPGATPMARVSRRSAIVCWSTTTRADKRYFWNRSAGAT